jgi:hypothetical protein
LVAAGVKVLSGLKGASMTVEGAGSMCQTGLSAATFSAISAARVPGRDGWSLRRSCRCPPEIFLA